MGSMRMMSLATWYQAGAALVAGLVCFWLWPAGAWGVLFVGAFAVSNFWAWQVLVRRSFGEGKPRPIYLVALGTKMLVTLGILTLIVVVLRPPALAIALGLSTLFVGLALAMAHLSLSRPKAERA